MCRILILANIRPVDSKNPINSVSFLTPTKFKPDEANEELPHVWKVFSQKPLTDGDLNDIFKGNYFHIFAKVHSKCPQWT